MYIVKRGFRNLGQVLTAGTEITDPAVIKHFKSRVSAGDIIVVTEQNYETTKAYFKVKCGVDIPDIKATEVVPVTVKAVPTTKVVPTAKAVSAITK